MGGDTLGEIHFFSHTEDGSPLWMDVTGKSVGVNSNYVWKPTHMTIQDLRGKENMFDLDVNGFEVQEYHGVVDTVFDEQSEDKSRYFNEIIDILKKRLNAAHVVIFNHRFRHRSVPLNDEQCDLIHRNPLFFPHVDNDTPEAYVTMKNAIGEEEAKKVMGKRFQIINVWRPIGSSPIVNFPLTICDYQSLDVSKDVHVSEVRGSIVTGAVCMISHHCPEAQKWYYMSEMKSNQMFLFKNFDSKSDVAQFGPHTAFICENTPLTDMEQCSLELRCLVFYDE